MSEDRSGAGGFISGTSFVVAEAQTALMWANSEEESWIPVTMYGQRRPGLPNHALRGRRDKCAGWTVFSDSLALANGRSNLVGEPRPISGERYAFAVSHLAFGRPFAFQGLAREPLWSLCKFGSVREVQRLADRPFGGFRFQRSAGSFRHGHSMTQDPMDI